MFRQFDPRTDALAQDENRIPYIVERIGDMVEPRGIEGVFREIADVCINVFFKEQLDAAPDDRVP